MLSSFHLLKAFNDIVLQLAADIHKNTAVSGDTHTQIAMRFGMLTGIEQAIDIRTADLRVQSAAVKICSQQRTKQGPSLLTDKLIGRNIQIQRAGQYAVRRQMQHRVEHRRQSMDARTVGGACVL